MATKTYPSEFIEACKHEFPLANELHDWLDEHDERVGKFLEHARSISFSEVRTALHREWCKIMNAEDSEVRPCAWPRKR